MNNERLTNRETKTTVEDGGMFLYEGVRVDIVTGCQFMEGQCVMCETGRLGYCNSYVQFGVIIANLR